MSLDDLMNSFREAWGVEVDRKPKTVRGLLELAKACQKDPTLAKDLAAAADRLADPVASVLEDCIRDLESTNDIEAGLLPHLEGVTDAYQSALEGLDLILDSPSDLNPAIALLLEGVTRQREHQEGIELWQKQPTCPRCGARSREHRMCQNCGVHLVVPDPNPPELPSASLSPNYLELRRAAGAVATGQERITSLQKAADSLAAELLQLVRLLKQAPTTNFDPQPFFLVLEQAFVGIERMRQFEVTCAVADLNQGWASVLQAGLMLQRLRETIPRS